MVSPTDRVLNFEFLSGIIGSSLPSPLHGQPIE